VEKILSASLSLLHKTVLKPAGFIKKASTFSRVHATHTELFNIQSSRWNGPWGRSFYVNCGLVFADLPLEHPWHYLPGTQWADRIESVVSEAPASWDYSEETMDAVQEKLGELVLQASNVMTRDLQKYRQCYLSRWQ
jgi:hypothetical protein